MAATVDLDADSWPLYAETRDRFIALARSLTRGQAGQAVPLTTGWTIAQVVAHVCGLNADLASGMRQGLGTDERTSHQVDTRADLSVGQVCDEWLSHGPEVESIMVANSFLGRRLAADLVIHLHDVQHALGLEIARDDEATISGGQTYATHTVDRWLEATGVSVAVELTDGSRFVPSAGGAVSAATSASTSTSASASAAPPTPTLTLRATPYDFLRSVSGRRSRAQVEGLDWSADPGLLIDHFSPYGNLREVDAPI